MYSPNKSAQKRLLQQFTPSKVIVRHDINGWLQTNQKKQLSIKKIPNKRLPPKPQPLGKVTVTNFENLKKKIQNLNNFQIFSVTKKKLYEAPSTQGSSPGQIINSNQTGSNSLKQKFENLVKISSFDDHLKDVQKTSKSQRPLIRLIQVKNEKQNMPDPSAKFEQRSRRMTKILNYNRMRNKCDSSTKKSTPLMIKKQIMSQSIDIVKGKLSANQYKALNMIVRKTEIVQLISIPSLEKMKIRV